MFLAQANIALFRWPLGDPRMAEFVERIQPVNELAERSGGFVWRYSGDWVPRDMGPPWDNPLLFFNLSVWRDAESLRRFIQQSAHVSVMQRREQWTVPWEGPSMAMWWIEKDVRPEIDDAIHALSSIAERGESCRAFTFRSRYRFLDHWLDQPERF